jgi:hypothetical protein
MRPIRSTSTIVFLPTQSEVGEWWVNITTEDSGGLMDVVLISFSVLNVNDVPVILSLSPANGTKYKEGKVVTFSIETSDEDGDDVTVTWMDGDEVLGIGSDLGVKLKPGEHTITVLVDDGTVEVEKSIIVVVMRKPEGSPGFGFLVLTLALTMAAILSVYRNHTTS